jgi:arginine exporter protein ArgO
MNLDLRLPLGLMFSIFGAILIGVGLFGSAALSAQSLGVNINLWWGLVMLIFGGVMLALSQRKGK